MNVKMDLAYQKLRDGKSILAKSRDEYAVNNALLCIHGCLDSYLEASSPLARTDLPRSRPLGNRIRPRLRDKLYQLRNDRIINEEERVYILWMRSVRNMAAHGERHTITHHHVERYATLVRKILDEDTGRKRMMRKPTTRKPDKPSTPSYKSAI